MEKIVIIGNGISGITAARFIRKFSDKEITVISKESKYFFSRTALMYVFMGHMRFKDTQPYEPHFWKKNRINLVEGSVENINYDEKKVVLSEGEKIDYDKLILAVGSKPNKFGWKGQDLKAVQGLYSKQDLESMELYSKDTKTAVIVGGGLIGVEMAEMFLTRNIKVKFLVREDRFWGGILPKADGEIVRREMEKHKGLELLFNEELEEILPDENDRAKAVKTKSGKEIKCEFVGLTAGVSPNIDFLKNDKLDLGRGIKVNSYLETNIPDVYAIGDCAEFTTPNGQRKPIEQVWYTGRMMGECVAQTVCKEKTAYKPGNWFNSAKFFDLEYQTYGWVWSELKENEEEFIWENTKDNKLLHFVFDKKTKAILGINTFGIRLRHEIFDKWLSEQKQIDDVIKEMSYANFDPEFYKNYEGQIIEAFNIKYNKQLKPAKKGWWRNLLTAK